MQGIGFYKAGQFDLALHHFNLALVKGSSDSVLWYNKARAHTQLNEPYLAAKAFDKALDSNRGYEKARTAKASLQFPRLLSFLIADLSLNKEGEIQIFEFGNGFDSGFSGFDALHPDSPVEKRLRQLLLKNITLYVFLTQDLVRPFLMTAY